MELKWILESLLFAAQKPLSAHELRIVLTAAAEQAEDETVRAFKKTPPENITAALEELQREHEAAGRTYRLACVAGAWQFVSQPEFAPWLRALLGVKVRPPRLSQPGLETLAIIAYRQPITRAEMEQIRGVAVDGVMQTLLERGLVVQSGRAEVIGRPALYSTTPAFLEYFGLRQLEDLPAADELRRIVVQRPEALLTVDPGLATAPPDSLQTAEGQPGAAESDPGSSAPRSGDVGEQPVPALPGTESSPP
ncbi:MAG: SMC-Scp complex subunit ScpB [Verrucomicrobia bacterium]|nr:SMC-Scp complex subunit ScpB [Verrucomicrobiota bacterium]